MCVTITLRARKWIGSRAFQWGVEMLCNAGTPARDNRFNGPAEM